MLGYVQSGRLADWGKKIGDELANTPIVYAVDPSFPFSSDSMPSTDSLNTYLSQHHRPTVGQPILISHTLLGFH